MAVTIASVSKVVICNAGDRRNNNNGNDRSQRNSNGRGSSNIWGMTVMIMTNAVEPMTVTPL